MEIFKFKDIINKIYEDTIEPEELLQEVGIIKNKRLKHIEEFFKELKQDPSNDKIYPKLSSIIKNLTGVRQVKFEVNISYNASTVFEYNWGTIFRNFFPRSNQEFNNNMNFYKINNHVDYIHIIIGSWLIKDLSPQELTAVLLHELGHAYYLPSTFRQILPKITTMGGPPLLAISLVKNIYNFFILLSVMLLINRSLTLLDHLEEINADRFVTKYGYGDELVNALKRFNKKRNLSEKTKTSLDKLKDSVNELVSMYISGGCEHPNDMKRIERILTDIKKKYIEIYPQFKIPIINNLKQLNLKQSV